ncbi:hypothetical protein FA15DRAFT_653294 [Coprinopsis marcescibilis]|uniref:Uncharacterized protein n=1 Tax=Coprinopsis marcescibilis TaxID=230819 RepID=A0A5C3L517_COPMA|nr:hypothetical protein FA15DRAFT_653294 [Coprinopsis marcescibilis]
MPRVKKRIPIPPRTDSPVEYIDPVVSDVDSSSDEGLQNLSQPLPRVNSRTHPTQQPHLQQQHPRSQPLQARQPVPLQRTSGTTFYGEAQLNSVQYGYQAGPNGTGPAADSSRSQSAAQEIQRLHQIITNSQLQTNKLTEQLRQLSIENQVLRNTAKSSSANNDSTKDDEEDELTNAAANHGRKFGLLHQVFIEDAWFMNANPHTTSVFLGRFKDEHSKKLGAVAQLYESVPVGYHDALEKSIAYQRKFTQASNDYQRQLMKRLREGIAAEVFGNKHLADYYRFSRANRPQLPECQALIAWPEAHNGVQIIRAWLFGPASIRPAHLNKTPPGMPNGKAWDVRGVTPGLLSLVWVISVFIHSTDNVFQEVGDQSGIKYRELYNGFQRYIIEALASDDKSDNEAMLSLFDWYNSIVFVHLKTAHSPRPAQTLTETRQVNEMAALMSGLKLGPRDDSIVEDIPQANHPLQPPVHTTESPLRHAMPPQVPAELPLPSSSSQVHPSLPAPRQARSGPSQPALRPPPADAAIYVATLQPPPSPVLDTNTGPGHSRTPDRRHPDLPATPFNNANTLQSPGFLQPQFVQVAVPIIDIDPLDMCTNVQFSEGVDNTRETADGFLYSGLNDSQAPQEDEITATTSPTKPRGRNPRAKKAAAPKKANTKGKKK